MPSERNLLRAAPARGIEKGAEGIDREARVIHGVSVISEGEAMGHGLMIDETTLDQVVENAQKPHRGVKARFGHPLMSSNAEGTFLGRMKNFRKVTADGEKARVRADLHLAEVAFSATANNVGEYTLDLADEDPEAFGVSIVFDGEPAFVLNEDGTRKEDPETGTPLLPLARVKRLWAADVVDEPATGDGMFARTVELSATFTRQLDALLAEESAAETIDAYLQRYAASRGMPVDELRSIVRNLFGRPPSAPSPGGAAATPAQTSTPAREASSMAGTPEQGSPGTGAPETNALADAHKRELEEAKATAAKEAAAAERSRVTTIQRLGARLGIPEGTVQETIEKGTTIEEASKQFSILDTAGTVPVKSSIKVGKDDRENFFAGAEAAFSARLGYADAKTAQDVRRSALNGLTIMGLARRCLELDGDSGVSVLSNEDVVRRIVSLSRRHQFAPGTAVTGDFVSLLSNVANKSLTKGWEAAATTYQLWCGTGNLADFKQADLVKVTEFADDMEIPEGEAARHGDFADTHEVAQLKVYGRLFCLSMQAMVNDDLNWFARVPQRMASASRRGINRRVYNYLFGANFAGPAILEDATTVFTAAHGNLAALGAGAAVTDTTLNAGWNAMTTQALPSPDGGRSAVMRTNIPPRYLLIGPHNRMNAHRCLSSAYLTEAGETGAVVGSQVANIFGPGQPRSMQAIEEPMLDYLITAQATYPWYLAADPNLADTITVFFLNGRSEPTVSREEARLSEPDGITWKIAHASAVAAVDYRGLYCNAGR